MRSVVDQGFARRGGETPEFVARTYYLARFFCRKLDKNEQKIGPRFILSDFTHCNGCVVNSLMSLWLLTISLKRRRCFVH